jgi:hypothetical protein
MKIVASFSLFAKFLADSKSVIYLLVLILKTRSESYTTALENQILHHYFSFFNRAFIAN